MGASRQVYSTSWWWAAIALMTLGERLWRWAIDGADGGVRPLDLVVDGLADVVQQAAHLGDLDVGPDLGRDDRGEMARLDHVVEHVLAVAGAELEPAEGLDDVGRQARHAGLVGGLLAGLAHDRVDLGARLGHDLLDPARVDPAVGDQLGDGQAGDLAADRVEARQDDRLGRVVDDEVDPGGLLERPDVAALATDDPALHLVRREMDDRDGVLGRVVGGDPLDGGHDDVARLVLGVLAGGPLDGPRDLDRVVLGLLADRLDEDGLGVLGRHVGDPLERDDLLGMGAGEVFAGLVELTLPFQQLAIALLEHVGPLVELLVTLEEPALEAGQLRPPSPGLLFGLALHPQLLVLGLEDELLLARAGLGFDPTRLGGSRLHGLGGPEAAQEYANGDATSGGQDGHRQEGQGFHLQFLPSDRLRAGRA